MLVNNVNLAAIGAFAEKVKADPAAAKLQKRVEGTWNFAGGKPQFSAVVTHGRATTVLQADSAPALGGDGLAPDPLQYMLFGLSACYVATLVTIASMEGIVLSEVKVVAENRVDVSKVFGLADLPLMENVSLRVAVKASVTDATLDRWQQAARERCPFAFTIANAVTLETRVVRAA